MVVEPKADERKENVEKNVEDKAREVPNLLLQGEYLIPNLLFLITSLIPNDLGERN